jgi:hypothetical protein
MITSKPNTENRKMANRYVVTKQYFSEGETHGQMFDRIEKQFKDVKVFACHIPS